MAKSELHRDYILELESELQEFEKKADATTKRLQILVYPAMIAFIILASFGFYLIYSLTSDVNRMADTISHMSNSIDRNMDSISGTMVHMSGKMDTLADSTHSMSTDVGSMSANVGTMSNNTVKMVNGISGLRSATYDMAASTNNMQRDMWSLNKNISTPLSFMNNFLPWKNDQSLPFQGSPRPLPQSYFAVPAQQPAYNGVNGLLPVPMPLLPMPDMYSTPLGVPLAPQTPTGVTVKSNDQSSVTNPLHNISERLISQN